ncbi:MAG: hypothetical protein WC365_04225 [Candidatus Babeliales bacterium]|jgi:hypothetical protein
MYLKRHFIFYAFTLLLSTPWSFTLVSAMQSVKPLDEAGTIQMAQRIVAQQLWDAPAEQASASLIQDELTKLSTNPTIEELKRRLDDLKIMSGASFPSATANTLIAIFLNKNEYTLLPLQDVSLLQRALSSVQNALQKRNVDALEKECKLQANLFILKWRQNPGYREKVTEQRDIFTITTLIQKLAEQGFFIPTLMGKPLEEEPYPSPSVTPTSAPKAQHETEAKQAETETKVAEEEMFNPDEESAVFWSHPLTLINSEISNLEQDLTGKKSLLSIAGTIAGILLTKQEHYLLGRDKPQSILNQAETEATGTFEQTALKKLKNKLVRLFTEFESKWATDTTVIESLRQTVENVIQKAKPKIEVLKAGATTPPALPPSRPPSPFSQRPSHPATPPLTPPIRTTTPPIFTSLPSPASSQILSPTTQIVTEATQGEEKETIRSAEKNKSQKVLEEILGIIRSYERTYDTEEWTKKRLLMLELLKSISDPATFATAQKEVGEQLLKEIREIIMSYGRTYNAEEWTKKRLLMLELLKSISDPATLATAQKEVGQQLLIEIRGIIMSYGRTYNAEEWTKKRLLMLELLKSISDPATLATAQKEVGQQLLIEIRGIIMSYGRTYNADEWTEKRSLMLSLLNSISDPTILAAAREEVGKQLFDEISTYFRLNARAIYNDKEWDKKRSLILQLLESMPDTPIRGAAQKEVGRQLLDEISRKLPKKDEEWSAENRKFVSDLLESITDKVLRSQIQEKLPPAIQKEFPLPSV